MYHHNLTTKLRDRVDITKSDGMERNNAEIDCLLEIDFIGTWLHARMIVWCGVRCHCDAPRVVIDPGKAKNKYHVSPKGDQDEQEDFTGLETKTHTPGGWMNG